MWEIWETFYRLVNNGEDDSGSTFARKKCALGNAKLEQMADDATWQKATTTLMREIFAIESSRRKAGGLKSHGKMLKSGKLRFGFGEKRNSFAWIVE